MKTNWTQATQNPHIAISGLLSCMETGRNCWIEIRDNTDPDIAFPIQEPSEESKQISNYEMLYSSPTKIKEEELKRMSDTERDLTLNYVPAFGTQEAIDEYFKHGTISPDLVCGMGVNFPIKKADFLSLRPDLSPNFPFWTTKWKLKKGLPYRTAVKGIKVFVVVNDDTKSNPKEIYKKAAEFFNNLSQI